jgi:hypothetical protein
VVTLGRDEAREVIEEHYLEIDAWPSGAIRRD